MRSMHGQGNYVRREEMGKYVLEKLEVLSSEASHEVMPFSVDVSSSYQLLIVFNSYRDFVFISLSRVHMCNTNSSNSSHCQSSSVFLYTCLTNTCTWLTTCILTDLELTLICNAMVNQKTWNLKLGSDIFWFNLLSIFTLFSAHNEVRTGLRRNTGTNFMPTEGF